MAGWSKHDPIPARLSVDPRHPWFHPHWSRHVEVYLDEQRITKVVLADTIEGWAEIFLEPFRRAHPDSPKLATARVRGIVTFRPREQEPQ